MTFDEAVAGGEPLLQDAILQDAQETLQLDFKGSATGKDGALFTDEGKLTKNGRRSIAKALSAFSNSAGGVVVIGVDCRTVDGIDSAQEVDQIPNWKAALSAVSSAVGDLLQPKNDGVRVAGFGSAKDDSAGYLVIDVPRSERRPHMCNMTKQYFKRSASGSYAMEHFDVEDAFRRTSVPELKLKSDVQRFMGVGFTSHFKIRLWLENVSTVTAFFPSLTIRGFEGIQFGWSDDKLPSVVRMTEVNRVTAYGNSEFVIHPGNTRQIEALQFAADFDEANKPQTVGGRPPNMAFLSFKYQVGARDMASREKEFDLRLYPLKWV